MVETLENKTNGAEFNFNSDRVFSRQYSGKMPTGEEVNAQIELIRGKSGYEFNLYFRDNHGKPVITERGKEYNFSMEPNLDFSYRGLINYVKEHNVELQLPLRYHEMQKESERLRQIYLEVVNNRKMKKAEREKLVKPNKEEREKLYQKMMDIYVTSALQKIGAQFINDLEPKIQRYMTLDGRDPKYGGVGGGPYLQNRRREMKVPKGRAGLGLRILPGSFESGKRR